jgi:hypothetical protein
LIKEFAMTKTINGFLLTLILTYGILSHARAQTNLAQNGSFEILGNGSLFAGWSNSGGVVGHVNEFGANGTKNYVAISGGARIWQNVPTVAGRSYIVRFALNYVSGPVRVWWNGASIGVTNYSSSIGAFWADVSASTLAATSSVSRLEFEGVGGVFLDEISIGWREEPPSVQTQVASRSTFEGGSVSFKVLALGGPPLTYQWSFRGTPIANATNAVFTVNAHPSDEGDDYLVTITNAFGIVSSLPATLRVLALPNAPLIVAQPKNVQMTAGYFAGFYVFAVGSEPLSYQWRFNTVAISGATNSHFSLPAVALTHAGSYTVLVSNKFGTTLSVPGTLSVQTGQGGGWVGWANTDYFSFDAPILDSDGTWLAGPNFVAQLYAGATSNALHAVGSPVDFDLGYPGHYFPAVARIPDVLAWVTAYLQIRVWDRSCGETFEESQTLGGKFGKSDILPVMLYPELAVPQFLPQMRSFSLQAGQPLLATAKLYPGSQSPNQTREWLLVGEAGAQYVIDYREPPNDWFPLYQVTNVTGTVTFVDSNAQNASIKFYRARIIEP